MTQEQIKKLEKLKSLLDSGILSQQEFNAEKAKIMSSQPAQAEPTRNDSSKTTTKKESCGEMDYCGFSDNTSGYRNVFCV
jgi:hypothetical protein